MTAGGHHVDCVAQRAYGQVYEPIAVAVHGNEIRQFVPPGIRQIAAALQVAQTLFPYVEGKDRRSLQLHGQHHADEEQQGRHRRAVIPGRRCFQDVAVDIRDDFRDTGEHRIHVGRVQGEFPIFGKAMGIDHIARFVDIGPFCPHGFQLVQDPVSFFVLFSCRRGQGRNVVMDLEIFRKIIINVIINQFTQYFVHKAPPK